MWKKIVKIINFLKFLRIEKNILNNHIANI